MKEFNNASGVRSSCSRYFSRNYDTESAFHRLKEWGWDEMYPSRKLTKTMVERWAKEHKHGWRLHRVIRKMIISERDLLKILRGN